MTEVFPFRAVSVAAVVVAAVLAGIWAPLGSMLAWLAVILAVAAVVSAQWRAPLLYVAAALQWGCLLALAWHFGNDHFNVRYARLYSAPELPLYLKLANLWGGDEGANFLLAAFCTTLAAVAARRSVAGTGVIVMIAVWYSLTALWLGPFAATPADWLARAPSQGMNAHLMKIWMVLHAPLVLAAYAWTLSLAGPALAALGGAQDSWPALAHGRARRAWALLSAGIGFGMLWAFEDAMYGQVWHWDPVQTAVFAVWCFLSAHLHGIAGWRRGQGSWRVVPVAAVLAAVMTAAAMAVTRNPTLASSHRYVDADTWISHLALAAVLLLLVPLAVLRGRGAPASANGRTSVSSWGLRLAQYGFVVAGVLAVAALVQAFAASMLGKTRPDEFKPFLGFIVNLTERADLPALLEAFDRWDVDGYVLAAALILPLLVFGLVGGWYFFRRISVRTGWLALAAATLLAAWTATSGITGRAYEGAGILSQNIVALLPLLDAALVAGAFLALGCVAWAVHMLRLKGARGVRASVPLAAIHLGAACILWGGILFTALNGYTQHEIELDAGSSEWRVDRLGYSIRLAGLETQDSADGGIAVPGSIRAMTRVQVRGPDGEEVDGETLYRDTRLPSERYGGPLRQVCELLDYRYARHMMEPGYILDPMIEHGWAQAIQVWVSPAGLIHATENSDQPAVAVVVVKFFPFSSLLWLGLVITVIGSAWLAFVPRASMETE